VVYCGGLENRFPLTGDGGSNPSLSAKSVMQDTIWIIIWVVVVGGLFAWLWRAGHLARFATYIALTREELRKCTWPTWGELKGSTVVVTISIFLLGGFTVGVDQIFFRLFLLLKL
jgi:preprotein translocase subunit SecE